MKSQNEDLIINIAQDLKIVTGKHYLKKEDKSNMKIFISHSSRNEKYGIALVKLLTGVGVKSEQIIFTSNAAYGIPIGQNIFNWLKERINEKPFVIYLLSPEYYSSIACLNEMGAAWVVENKHAMLFTPNFELNSYEFQNGALDPREIGFYINDEDRLTAFIESLKDLFEISSNQVLVNQQCREFIKQIEIIQKSSLNLIKVAECAAQVKVKSITNDSTSPKISADNTIHCVERFFQDLINNKLKDEEVLIVQYIFDTARYNLGTGWQESNELKNIEAWEDLNNLNNTLSRNYNNLLRRLEMRKLVKVSDYTSNGNPKEFRIIDEMQNKLFDLPAEFHNKVIEIKENMQGDLPF